MKSKPLSKVTNSMQHQTGETYVPSKYSKFLSVAGNKEGKTVWAVGSALGVLPWQKEGGLVSDPKHLHILAADMDAVAGCKRFLTEFCKAPTEALKFHVWNFQDDIRRVFAENAPYQHGLFMELRKVVDEIQRLSAGKGAVVLVSSLTGFARGIERSLFGPPTGQSAAGKGYGSIDLWTMLEAQLFQFQNMFQVDDWHCIWEGHIMPKGDPKGGGEPKPDSIAVRGGAGINWGYNTQGNFRIRRQAGDKFPGSQVDKVIIETRPKLDFISNGRGFAETLAAQETDLTLMCRKLGYQVGHWGAKSKPAK